MNLDLIVFDLDGTIIVNPTFYWHMYSGTLNEVVREHKGEAGIKVLAECREKYSGKGELALQMLGIPYSAWAAKLSEVSVDIIEPQPELCARIRNLNPVKVIYTGSPVVLAWRMLEKIGFDPDRDFDLIIGWQEPEAFPVKWACSLVVFRGILDKFGALPGETIAVGDVWETDLLPAKCLGIKTAIVGNGSGMPDSFHPSLSHFLDSLEHCA